MNMMTDPWMTIPAAAVYCGVGAAVSSFVFNKLAHVTEYTLNKAFGDYDNPKKTLDGRVIVSMYERNNYYYYIQNVALTVIVAIISSVAAKALALAGCPNMITVSLLVGGVAASILFSLINMIAFNTGGLDGRWVQLSDAEIEKYGINKDLIDEIIVSKHVYCSFGSAPERFAGAHDSDD